MPKAHHSNDSHNAMLEADAHNLATQQALIPDAVPPAEQGTHAHSAAAHLHAQGTPNTKPQGNLRQGSDPGSRNEPPMVIQREGKQHRD